MASALLSPSSSLLPPSWLAPVPTPSPRVTRAPHTKPLNPAALAHLPKVAEPARAIPEPPLLLRPEGRLAELPLAAPLAKARPTRRLTIGFLALCTIAVALYGHTLRIEGDANRQQQSIRKIKEGNHYLQVQLAQTTSLSRVETEATDKLNMVPTDRGVFLALPADVAELADVTLIPGREPAPLPLLHGI